MKRKETLAPLAGFELTLGSHGGLLMNQGIVYLSTQAGLSTLKLFVCMTNLI
jgi:hypothetical protein